MEEAVPMPPARCFGYLESAVTFYLDGRSTREQLEQDLARVRRSWSAYHNCLPPSSGQTTGSGDSS